MPEIAGYAIHELSVRSIMHLPSECLGRLITSLFVVARETVLKLQKDDSVTEYLVS
jgi:hypothetical protein